MKTNSLAFPALILFGALALALWRLGEAPLYDAEAFYAETGREMLESRDWLTPRFDYDRFLDKPPLYYWLLMPAYRLLGTTERAARLPAALAMAGCVGLTVLFGSILFDRRTGCLAGLLLATSMGFYIYSHAVLVEPLLTFWITASLLSFWLYYRDAARRAWLWLMYACWAFGLLTKGLTSLVFPWVILAVFLRLRGGWKNLRPLFSWRGWLIVVGLGLPWHLWIALHQKGYLWFYFVHEQFLRFLDLRRIKDSPLPTYAFLTLLIPILFPWSLYLPQSILFHLRKWREEKERCEPSLFVLLWGVVVLGFFCVSKFKLDYYSMPAWPALTLAIARFLESRMEQPRAAWKLLAPVAFMLFASAAGFFLMPFVAQFMRLELPYPWLLEEVRKALAILLVGSAAASCFLFFRRLRTAILCLSATMLPIMGLAQQAMLRLSPDLSNRELSQVAARCLDSLPASAAMVQGESDEDIYVGGEVFYTGRKVWLVMPPERQAFPLGRKFYLTPQELASWWGGDRPVLLIEDRAKLGKNPSYIIARSGARVLVANRPYILKSCPR